MTKLDQAIQLLEQERNRINSALTTLKAAGGGAAGGGTVPVKKFKLSAEARKKISEAQKQRWAAIKKG